ncbi:MAG: amidohydrolase [Bacteroidota bacterium]
MSINNFPVEDIIKLRRELHRNAELSLSEYKTKNLIVDFLTVHAASSKIIYLAGSGIAVVFDSGNPGITLMFRADTDALPIQEDASLHYASCNKDVSHKCGHDGHSAILCGLACVLQNDFAKSGKIILMFQPAEETGQGALNVHNDKAFKDLEPDFIFALHNLPGFEKNAIIIKKEQFASASKGMIIKLKGRSYHAAYPDQGVNPAFAFSEITQGIADIPEYSDSYDNFILTTIVYAKLGEPSFGTAAGYAEIHATLRSYDNHNMQRLVHECSLIVDEKSKEYGLEYSIEWADEFEETYNHPEAVEIIEKAAIECHLKIIHLPFPFHWSEDFGRFTSKYKGAMFGLGAGKVHAELHTDKYDFPDEIIETGINIFYNIYKDIINK